MKQKHGPTYRVLSFLVAFGKWERPPFWIRMFTHREGW